MKIFSIFEHDTWFEIQKRSPEWARHFIMPILGRIREYAILVVRPYLTVYQLKGRGQGGPITLTYAVSGADTDLKLFLKDNLLLEAEKVEEDIIQSFPLWRLGKLLDGSMGDLTFINAGENLIRRLPAQNAVVMPRLVDQILVVRGEWETVLQRFHSTVRRNELRLIRKYGYKTEVSYRDADFEMFFQKMYLPSVKLRHGQQAHIMPYAKAYKRFKQGLLFLTTRENAFVSGGLCDTQVEPDVVHFLLTGVMQADQKLIKEGAQSALYHAIAQWANSQGYKAVDFEATEPYLKKGILQHKRKWGMAARIPPNMHKRLWFKVHRNTPSVNQLLKDNPCITIDEQGELQGLFFADDPDQIPPETRAEWDKLCAMPGLNGYRICSIEDLVQNYTLNI